jgi:hypothetical protein
MSDAGYLRVAEAAVIPGPMNEVPANQRCKRRNLRLRRRKSPAAGDQGKHTVTQDAERHECVTRSPTAYEQAGQKHGRTIPLGDLPLGLKDAADSERC